MVTEVSFKKVDSMQNYFDEVIRNNSGNTEDMFKEIWAIFHHMIQSDIESIDKQYDLCTGGVTRWCTFLRDTTKYDNDKRLLSVCLNELKPLLIRLSSDDLLSRCLQGFTQNKN